MGTFAGMSAVVRYIRPVVPGRDLTVVGAALAETVRGQMLGAHAVECWALVADGPHDWVVVKVVKRRGAIEQCARCNRLRLVRVA